MIKQRINAALLFFLLTAFLAVQWTPAHAHLTSQHHHSGERHQHSVLAHAHQAADIHADAIDVGHPQLDNTQVVNLDHDALTFSCFHLDTPSAPCSRHVFPLQLVEAIAFALPADRNDLPDLLPAHIGQPRAPPPLV